MSSTENLQEKVSALTSKAEKASELKEEAEKVENRRRIASQKNREFRRLNKLLNEIESRREKFEQWLNLAQSMGIDINEQTIQNTFSDIRTELDDFLKTNYTSYEDGAAVRDLQDRIEELDDITAHTSRLQNQVEAECEDRLEDVQRTKTVLQIPDIGTAEDKRKLEEIASFLRKVSRGNIPKNAASQWEEYEDDLGKIRLSLDEVQDRYGLSNRTIKVVKRFLDGDELMLSELDADILADIQELKEFSKRLEVSFTQQ